MQKAITLLRTNRVIMAMGCIALGLLPGCTTPPSFRTGTHSMYLTDLTGATESRVRNLMGAPDKQLTSSSGQALFVYLEKPDPFWADLKAVGEAASAQADRFEEVGYEDQATELRRIKKLADLARWIPHDRSKRVLKVWLSRGRVARYQLIGPKGVFEGGDASTERQLRRGATAAKAFAWIGYLVWVGWAVNQFM